MTYEETTTLFVSFLMRVENQPIMLKVENGKRGTINSD